jgi:hypothetical protein
VEGVEGIEARHLPQVAVAEVAGGGRNRQATAAVIRVAREGREVRKEANADCLGRFDRPSSSAGGFWFSLLGWADPLGQGPKIQFEFKTNLNFF